jgi:hypothetical protein
MGDAMSDGDYADMYKSGRTVTFWIDGVSRDYPLAYIEALVAGETTYIVEDEAMPVEPLPPEILRVIVRDWLKELKRQWYV